jgi:hypothetical protein
VQASPYAQHHFTLSKLVDYEHMPVYGTHACSAKVCECSICEAASNRHHQLLQSVSLASTIKVSRFVRAGPQPALPQPRLYSSASQLRLVMHVT